MAFSYDNCTLCERRCGANRTVGEYGICRSGNLPYIARAALHAWEEPSISGERGSGTIFFSGCSLGCVFCQNSDISRTEVGTPKDASGLAVLMERLAGEGAHNINFVTPTHHAPTIAEAVRIFRSRGYTLPIVYNTSSYDTPDTLHALSGLVDIYLSDFKYFRRKSAAELAHAPDYPEAATAAIEEMVRQRPIPTFSDGLMTGGVIIRILLLPGHLAEARLSLSHLYSRFGDRVYFSLMSQYTPMPNMTPPLDRRVTRAEYRALVSHAERLGIVNAYIQEHESASAEYIPPFPTKKS
ncbi:MAG: 4Fe-4S cluster-binding domain-containing protein [Clostridia bacterium]|nr:4Fe-4S cluster-binding domain-containing protein [Clostridia bacterium]